MASHGVGAHTKKPPVAATAEVRAKLEERNRTVGEGATAGSGGTTGTVKAKDDGKVCEDCE